MLFFTNSNKNLPCIELLVLNFWAPISSGPPALRGLRGGGYATAHVACDVW